MGIKSRPPYIAILLKIEQPHSKSSLFQKQQQSLTNPLLSIKTCIITTEQLDIEYPRRVLYKQFYTIPGDQAKSLIEVSVTKNKFYILAQNMETNKQFVTQLFKVQGEKLIDSYKGQIDLLIQDLRFKHGRLVIDKVQQRLLYPQMQISDKPQHQINRNQAKSHLDKISNNLKEKLINRKMRINSSLESRNYTKNLQSTQYSPNYKVDDLFSQEIIHQGFITSKNTKMPLRNLYQSLDTGTTNYFNNNFIDQNSYQNTSLNSSFKKVIDSQANKVRQFSKLNMSNDFVKVRVKNPNNIEFINNHNQTYHASKDNTKQQQIYHYNDQTTLKEKLLQQRFERDHQDKDVDQEKKIQQQNSRYILQFIESQENITKSINSDDD
eukprot:403354473